MTQYGTVIDGRIVLDQQYTLPEGMRVRVEPAIEERFEYPHPLAPYDREKELALLRERIADPRPGIPLKEAMARIAAKLNLPAIDPE